MKLLFTSAVTILLLISATSLAIPPNNSADAAPNGITIPKGYKKWKLVAVSHRNDNHSLRAILGNHQAHKAKYAQGKWNWPEGTILAKLVWKEAKHPQWSDAVVPGEFVHIEFMFKDKQKYASTGGWGYARWVGNDLKPYANDGSECYSCHTKAENADYVFTKPVPLP